MLKKRKKEKKANIKHNTQAPRKISLASPNLLSQTLKGWDTAWDSLGAGVVPGMRCGPPDSITCRYYHGGRELHGVFTWGLRERLKQVK